jgi:hypothetical protein
LSIKLLIKNYLRQWSLWLPYHTQVCQLKQIAVSCRITGFGVSITAVEHLERGGVRVLWCYNACCELNPKIAPYRLNEALFALKASHQPIKGCDFRPETTFFATHNKRYNSKTLNH